MSEAYRAYTTKFDMEARADQLETILGPLRHDQQVAVDEAWDALQIGLLAWKTRLHLVAVEAAARIRAAMDESERTAIAVTLLFDQSGSMRGQKMLFSAATADVVQEFLVTLGFLCEVLGFTTSRWRGGRSRSRWTWHFRPRKPGRLNDLLHIIYQSADDRRAGTAMELSPDAPARSA